VYDALRCSCKKVLRLRKWLKPKYIKCLFLGKASPNELELAGLGQMWY
jgi:hypothetical protein